MRPTIIAAFAGMLAVTPASADELTCNRLYQACQLSADFCQGFAAGIVTTTWAPVLTAMLCLPQGGAVDANQVRDVLMKYMREHPEKRHHHFADVVAASISDAWPCEG